MRTLILLSCFLALLAGCKKSNEEAPLVNNKTDSIPVLSVVIPNRVGATWLYLVNDTTADLQGNTTSVSQYNMVVKIVDSVQLSSGILAKVWRYSTPTDVDTNYVYQSNDTLYYADRNNFLFPKTWRKYIVPLVLNNSWNYTNYYFLLPSVATVKVDRVDTLTIGQNTFANALRLSGWAGTPDQFYQVTEWNVNNIGIVRRYFKTSYNLPFQRKIEWLLVEYSNL